MNPRVSLPDVYNFQHAYEKRFMVYGGNLVARWVRFEGMEDLSWEIISRFRISRRATDDSRPGAMRLL